MNLTVRFGSGPNGSVTFMTFTVVAPPALVAKVRKSVAASNSARRTFSVLFNFRLSPTVRELRGDSRRERVALGLGELAALLAAERSTPEECCK